MGLSANRVVPAVVRVGDKEVVLTIIEAYAMGADCGIPVHIKVIGPDGLVTEGKLPDAWNEMLELLGVGKPALSDRHSAVGPTENPTPVATQGPAAALSTSATSQNQTQDPSTTVSRAGESAREPSSAQDGRIGGDHVYSRGSESQNQNQHQNQNQTQTPNQNPAGAVAAPVVWAAPVVSAADEFEDDMKLDEEEEIEDVEAEETPGLNENILRDSVLGLLNRRIYNDDPPLKIDEKMVAFIPYLESTQEAANLIRHINENIQLTEMKADASRRASNLNYLKKANRAKRCGHVKVSGQTCGSPALRGQLYCYFHAQAHGAGLELPLIEDQSSLQLAYMKVAQQVAANKIDPTQARVLLQVLEKAGRGLPKSESLVERRFPGI